MHQNAIRITIVLFALIVVGMFVFAYLTKTEQSEVSEDDTTTETEDPYGYITRIDGKHFYIDGTHTVVGEILMPTPCDLLNTESIVAESYPEQVTLNFSVLNTAETCAAVMTTARFKVEASASEAATFNARFNGRSVELNLTPAAAGETPDEFELYIKG